MQQCGRGGRDGKPCIATLYVSTTELNVINSQSTSMMSKEKGAMTIEGLGIKNRYLLYEYVTNANLCRREYISSYMDAVPTRCNPENPKCQLCDNCEKYHLDHPDGTPSQNHTPDDIADNTTMMPDNDDKVRFLMLD